MFGLDSDNDLLESQGGEYLTVSLDMIEVKTQVREIFEDEENTLADLSASIIAYGVLQPILLRPMADGYELIAGERRYRAAKLAGLETIPAYIREMTDEEAEDTQFAENIQRKNLTQIEEAKKIQRDLDRLGSVKAVLELHQKSNAWLSQIRFLLKLPKQAKRLVTENVSADIMLINKVRVIEKYSPEKAKKLVEDLKQTRGKGSAREKVDAVSSTLKPNKKFKYDIVENQVNVFESDEAEFSDIEDDDIILESKLDSLEEMPSFLNNPTLTEFQLYPYLVEYLKTEHRLFCQRIDEKRSKNQRGSGGNQWLHPDIVAMQPVDKDWNELVRACVQKGGGQRVRLWSFEVKKELNSSNVRMSFFQAVSNSSWANEGYLVATTIANNIDQELRMLSALHGIGVILLIPENLMESGILLPAMAKPEIDWQSVNRIVVENDDFKDFIHKVSIYYQTGSLRDKEWNSV
jgi:ParB/RepB/Spo0J family partition protein